MLAQNFKTAEELLIPPTLYDALIKVLGMLERKEIPKHLFDMGVVGAPDCGTAGCIYGWAKAITPRPVRADWCKMEDSDVWDLFGPPEGHKAWRADRAEAARAIRNYLRTKKPCWAEVMK